ncbi:MAG: DUF1848 family protein [Promethearchaeota archaeon]
MNANIPIVKSPIISCSRRCDVPAFLMDWVMEKIKTGYVDVRNPFNPRQVYRVSLLPEDVKCWVWWSKNFGFFIKYYNQKRALFNQYKAHYFHFTINSPSELEPNIKISLEKRFKQLKWLINEFGTLAVNFRFDPIVFYMKGNQIHDNLSQFEYIIETISSLGLKEMIFSFVTIYPKVKKRMIARGKYPIPLSLQEKKEIILKLLSFCKKHDIMMKACCQPDLLKISGIEQARCIDAFKIEALIGEPLPKLRDRGQRKECNCHKSKDIGGYTGIFKCKYDCDYCYASPSRK